jgi:hypothetical protein
MIAFFNYPIFMAIGCMALNELAVWLCDQQYVAIYVHGGASPQVSPWVWC